ADVGSGVLALEERELAAGLDGPREGAGPQRAHAIVQVVAETLRRLAKQLLHQLIVLPLPAHALVEASGLPLTHVPEVAQDLVGSLWKGLPQPLLEHRAHLPREAHQRHERLVGARLTS